MTERTVLDCRTFSFDLPGARALYGKLIDIWYSRPDSEPLLKPIFATVGVVPADLDWTRMTAVWDTVLTRAAQLGHLRQLAELLVEQTNTPALQGFFETLPSLGDLVVATGRGAFDSRLLAQRRPFLDRRNVRDSLTDLSTPTGARVLVVDGPRGSGRSHIWYLVSDGLARLVPKPPPPVRVQPSQWSGEAWGPLQLMTDIAQGLDWPVPEVDLQAQPDTHIRLLGRWFRTRAGNENEPRWLVIDDLDGAFVTDAGQRMAADIAYAAATAQAGPFRIVMLGFKGTLATDADAVAAREAIAYLDATALRDYFCELASEVGEQLTPDAADLIVAQAAGAPPYPVPLPFQQIGSGIGKLAEAYVGGAGGENG